MYLCQVALSSRLWDLVPWTLIFRIKIPNPITGILPKTPITGVKREKDS